MHGIPKGLLFVLYYSGVAAIGIPANLVVIVILLRGRCSLSRCISCYLLAMAVTDLVFIIMAAIFNRTAGIYFQFSFLSITPICKLNFAFTYGFRDCSVWITVAFTFDRYVAICCQKLKPKYCTERTAVVVVGTICALSCITHIPYYFVYEPVVVINGIPWLCEVRAEFYTSPWWIAFDTLQRISVPCLPFILILLFNALTVRHIFITMTIRRRILVNKNAERQTDGELENRRRSILLLFCVSAGFILLWFLFLIRFLYVRIAKLSYFTGSDVSNSKFILEESAFMLQLLSFCINPFIYVGTQSQLRTELKNWLKYVVNGVVGFCNF